MSEIFSWMKQGPEKGKRILEIAVPRVEAVQNPPASEPEKIEEPSPLGEAIAPRVEVHSTVQFDLKGADYRVKHVLDPITLVGEQFRRLRAILSLMQKQRGIKALLVTSACPGEGKTFAACSLAGVLAQDPGRRVLLIDADLRKPRAEKQVGMKADAGTVTGLSEVLRGEIDIMDSIAGSLGGDLFLLPAGKIPANPSELLSSPILEKSLKMASHAFDWVVIDSPPVLALSDASVMAPVVDAILLVVQAAVTPSKLVKEATSRLGPEKICGVVMNRVKYLRASHYYYHYYHDKERG